MTRIICIFFFFYFVIYKKKVHSPSGNDKVKEYTALKRVHALLRDLRLVTLA